MDGEGSPEEANGLDVHGVYLREMLWHQEGDSDSYPWNLEAFKGLNRVGLDHPITFFVGDNGSGKSTLLEAIALASGFNAEGGSRNHRFAAASTESSMHRAMRLIWSQKTSQGFFFRAESFYQFATYLEELTHQPCTSPGQVFGPYGGKSLHERSHGESFLALFSHRLSLREPALFLFDEPEAALSPTGQLAFLRMMLRWEASGLAQCIIATHSPILLGYPHATILDFDHHPLRAVTSQETLAYQVTKSFLDDPGRLLAELFRDDD